MGAEDSTVARELKEISARLAALKAYQNKERSDGR